MTMEFQSNVLFYEKNVVIELGLIEEKVLVDEVLELGTWN